jgi:hypothetical protein
MDARRKVEPGGTASSAGSHLYGVVRPSTADGWAVGVFHLKARGHHWPEPDPALEQDQLVRSMTGVAPSSVPWRHREHANLNTPAAA